MSIKFVKKTIDELDVLFNVTANELSISIKPVSLQHLLTLKSYGLGGDKEHDYSKFLKAYQIDTSQYVLLFGNKFVTDWKWLGHDDKNLSDKFLINLYDIT